MPAGIVEMDDAVDDRRRNGRWMADRDGWTGFQLCQRDGVRILPGIGGSAGLGSVHQLFV